MDFLKSFVELPESEYEPTFLDTYLKPESEDDKLGIVDVKVKTKRGKIIDVEIQVNPVKNIGKRLAIARNLKLLGNSPDKIIRVTGLSLDDIARL